MSKKGLLERLADGPVIGDGSMCMTLEKRGYCRAGPWTPEAVLLYPDAVRQLLREYLRAGSDVLQTPCFYSSDGKLKRSESTFKVSSIDQKWLQKLLIVTQYGQQKNICRGLLDISTCDGDVTVAF